MDLHPTAGPRVPERALEADHQLAVELLHIPSGERYELCRSVHAEANAIISASRRDMIGATIYLVGRDALTNELLPNAMSCSMCKRQIINAGIERVVIRTSPTEYSVIPVSDWVENDDSIFSLDD
jgi:dCMP deaminase